MASLPKQGELQRVPARDTRQRLCKTLSRLLPLFSCALKARHLRAQVAPVVHFHQAIRLGISNSKPCHVACKSTPSIPETQMCLAPRAWPSGRERQAVITSFCAASQGFSSSRLPKDLIQNHLIICLLQIVLLDFLWVGVPLTRV